CNLCERSQTKLTCADCVRGKLYARRYESIVVVKDRDDAGEIIKQQLEDASDFGACLRARHDTEDLQERVKDIQGYADGLRRELAEYSGRVAALRKANQAKKESLKEARNVFEQRKEKAFADVKRDIRKKSQGWNVVHDRTGEARVFLCRE